MFYLSNYCTGFEDYERFERYVKACGAGAELATWWTYPGFDALMDEQVSRFAGKYPVTLHSPFLEYCCVRDSGQWHEAMAALDRAFGWYADFDAASMVVHTHSAGHPAEEKTQWQRLSVENMCLIAEMYRERGFNMLVENVGYAHAENVLFDRDEFISLFDELPADVGCLIDTGHAFANHWDVARVVERLGDRIKAFHLHNTDGVLDLHYSVYEEGMYLSADRFDDLLRSIKDNCPDADLVLEYCPYEKIGEDLFKRDINRIADVMKL